VEGNAPFNKAYNFSKPLDIYFEIETLAKHLAPTSLIHFSDSIFNLNWDSKSDLIDRLTKSNYDLNFSCDTRVDLMTVDQVKQMANAGFKYIRMGFENVNDDILAMSNKSISNSMQIEACDLIRRVDNSIAIHAYMMTGLPGTKRTTLMNDALSIRDLILNDHVDIVGNKIFVPYPGLGYSESKNSSLFIDTKEWKRYDRRSYPVYHFLDFKCGRNYSGYLFQEAILTQTYKEKLEKQGVVNNFKNVSYGLDYLFTSYAADN